ncbi:MAG: hypothetical protein NTV44_00635 [Firmicutes bacterium]|nr:hypothetical protein [Bacillota bacterium]
MGLFKLISLYRTLEKHLYHFSVEEIRLYQQEQVLDLVRYAKENSPFYHDSYHGLPLKNLEDFRHLPTINKAKMMKYFDTINTADLKKEEVMEYALDKELNKDYLGYYRDRYVVGLSSGTSGNKGLYVTPKALTTQLPAAFLSRGGVRISDLPARILFMLRVFSQGFSDINAPFLKLKYLHTMTPVKEIVQTLKKQRINILMAPPSLLRVLLPFAEEIHGLKKIITYAEVLEKEEKARFALAFHCPVLEIYQASEGQVGSPCKKGQLHINEDMIYVELYDEKGEPVQDTKTPIQRMIVTNLVNRVQPLIRYEMNDLIALGEPCSCGSHFRVIDHIIGRHDDVLLLTDEEGNERSVFPDLVSRWIMTTSDAIREYRVFHKQRTNNLKIEVELLGEATDLEEKLTKRLHDEFHFYNIEINVEVVYAHIALSEGNLKFKRFIVTP